MEYTLTRSRNKWLLIIVIMIGILALLPWPPIQHNHAYLRHGEDAKKAWQCKDDPNAFRYLNPITNRFGFICQVDGEWYVLILSIAGGLITAFRKEKMKRKKQLDRYMKNAGYDTLS